VGGCGLDSSGSGQGQVASCCEHGNEPSGTIKGREFIGYLSDCQLLKKDCTPQSMLVISCMCSSNRFIRATSDNALGRCY